MELDPCDLECETTWKGLIGKFWKACWTSTRPPPVDEVSRDITSSGLIIWKGEAGLEEPVKELGENSSGTEASDINLNLLGCKGLEMKTAGTTLVVQDQEEEEE